jgi:hypothetical protein
MNGSCSGIEITDDADMGITFVRITQTWLSASSDGPKPGLRRLAVKSHFVLKKQNKAMGFLTSLF